MKKWYVTGLVMLSVVLLAYLIDAVIVHSKSSVTVLHNTSIVSDSITQEPVLFDFDSASEERVYQNDSGRFTGDDLWNIGYLGNTSTKACVTVTGNGSGFANLTVTAVFDSGDTEQVVIGPTQVQLTHRFYFNLEYGKITEVRVAAGEVTASTTAYYHFTDENSPVTKLSQNTIEAEDYCMVEIYDSLGFVLDVVSLNAGETCIVDASSDSYSLVEVQQ